MRGNASRDVVSRAVFFMGSPFLPASDLPLAFTTVALHLPRGRPDNTRATFVSRGKMLCAALRLPRFARPSQLTSMQVCNAPHPETCMAAIPPRILCDGPRWARPACPEGRADTFSLDDRVETAV